MTPTLNRLRIPLCPALALLASLHAADQPAKPNQDQSTGIDPDDGTSPRPNKAIPPKFIPNPGSTADYNRAKRTCTSVLLNKPTVLANGDWLLPIGRLQSGNLLLVKHLGIDEDPLSAGKAKQRRELTAFLSKDDVKTWSA